MKKSEIIILEKDVILPEPVKTEMYKIGENPPRYFITPDSARKHLATHTNCPECDEIIRMNSYCPICSTKRSNENYLKKEIKEWNGTDALVIYNSDTYFFDEEDLENYLEENDGLNPDDLQLMICEPIYLNELEESYLLEDIPEVYEQLSDIDKGLAEKFTELNEYIKQMKSIGWSEGRYRTNYKK